MLQKKTFLPFTFGILIAAILIIPIISTISTKQTLAFTQSGRRRNDSMDKNSDQLKDQNSQSSAESTASLQETLEWLQIKIPENSYVYWAKVSEDFMKDTQMNDSVEIKSVNFNGCTFSLMVEHSHWALEVETLKYVGPKYTNFDYYTIPLGDLDPASIQVINPVENEPKIWGIKFETYKSKKSIKLDRKQTEKEWEKSNIYTGGKRLFTLGASIPGPFEL